MKNDKQRKCCGDCVGKTCFCKEMNCTSAPTPPTEMNDLKPFEHGSEGTHAVCLKHDKGGKSTCCECNNRTDCEDKQKEKLKKGAEIFARDFEGVMKELAEGATPLKENDLREKIRSWQFASCPTAGKEPFLWKWTTHGLEMLEIYIKNLLAEARADEANGCYNHTKEEVKDARKERDAEIIAEIERIEKELFGGGNSRRLLSSLKNFIINEEQKSSPHNKE